MLLDERKLPWKLYAFLLKRQRLRGFICSDRFEIRRARDFYFFELDSSELLLHSLTVIYVT